MRPRKITPSKIAPRKIAPKGNCPQENYLPSPAELPPMKFSCEFFLIYSFYFYENFRP